MRSIFVALLAVAGGTKVVSAQAAQVRITLHFPANIVVRAFAPDSARFSLQGAEPVGPGDTLTLKDGAVVSYDRSSGPIQLLVRGVAEGQTVSVTSTNERKTRWAAFITHDVAISARGESPQIQPVTRPVVAVAQRDR